jgi:hypothetical protein
MALGVARRNPELTASVLKMEKKFHGVFVEHFVIVRAPFKHACPG